VVTKLDTKITCETLDERRGVFVVEPLERGYGTTLGSALRRVLLASIPGAAVTRVRFEGYHHEYETLPGVKESVLEVLLNIKSLALRLEDPEPKHLYLNADGPKTITAADLETEYGVSVVDPDHYITTLDEDGHLALEMEVEAGYGYQPAERTLRITRGCLAVLAECRNPTIVVTKGWLVTRDVDLLAELAAHDAASVLISVTSLDPDLARILEPGASPPSRRLEAIETLARAGVPVGALVAPVIPGINDHEIPRIAGAVASAGAGWASKVLLRLPHAVAPLFEEWLDRHFPERKGKVVSKVRAMRGGKLYDARFGERQRGTGLEADHTEALFALALRRHGLARQGPTLSAAAFRRPGGEQLGLLPEPDPGPVGS